MHITGGIALQKPRVPVMPAARHLSTKATSSDDHFAVGCCPACSSGAPAIPSAAGFSGRPAHPPSSASAGNDAGNGAPENPNNGKLPPMVSFGWGLYPVSLPLFAPVRGYGWQPMRNYDPNMGGSNSGGNWWGGNGGRGGNNGGGGGGNNGNGNGGGGGRRSGGNNAPYNFGAHMTRSWSFFVSQLMAAVLLLNVYMAWQVMLWLKTGRRGSYQAAFSGFSEFLDSVTFESARAWAVAFPISCLIFTHRSNPLGHRSLYLAIDGL